jgi:hypothetical protein
MSHQSQIALPEGVATGIATAERSDEAAAGPWWLWGVRRAPAELEPVDDRARLLDRAPRALCENTLFERAIVTLVEDSSLVFVTMHMDDDVQGKLIRDLWRAEPPARSPRVSAQPPPGVRSSPRARSSSGWRPPTAPPTPISHDGPAAASSPRSAGAIPAATPSGRAI